MHHYHFAIFNIICVFAKHKKWGNLLYLEAFHLTQVTQHDQHNEFTYGLTFPYRELVHDNH